jgi:hypothetical protein
MDSNRCIIHFRGGDFAGQKDVFLNLKYYVDAMRLVREINSDVNFQVITNDVERAKVYFPKTEIVSPYAPKEVFSGPDSRVDSRVRRDFAIMQNARYLILCNSSFSWWAAWTNQEAVKVIAPKYWARHNLDGPYWSSGGIIVPNWDYLGANGELDSGKTCQDSYLDFVESGRFQYKIG